MCGIVGFTGTKEAAPILLSGLSKLEYRGYDSAGIAVTAPICTVSPGSAIPAGLPMANRMRSMRILT